MKNFLKTYWKTLAFFTLAGLIGGFFAGLYLLDSYPAEIVEEIEWRGAKMEDVLYLSKDDSGNINIILKEEK